jgi:hypothetical protein
MNTWTRNEMEELARKLGARFGAGDLIGEGDLELCIMQKIVERLDLISKDAH